MSKKKDSYQTIIKSIHEKKLDANYSVFLHITEIEWLYKYILYIRYKKSYILTQVRGLSPIDNNNDNSEKITIVQNYGKILCPFCSKNDRIDHINPFQYQITLLSLLKTKENAQEVDRLLRMNNNDLKNEFITHGEIIQEHAQSH